MESIEMELRKKEEKNTNKTQARKINYIFYLTYQKYNENLCILFSVHFT